MTDKEKAKAYDEALERAQKATRAGSDVAMDIVQYIFPQLAESEDERIRKVIVKYFKELHVESWINLEIPNILAWLEKQKEQKPSGETNVEPDSKIPREEYLYHLLANNIITFTDYTYLLAKKPFDYECANIPQKDYTPVEQKPAEWNDEEYGGRLFDIEHYLDGTLQLSPDRRIACINFLKSLYNF